MGRCRLALASVKLTTEFFFSTPSRRCGRANEARIGRLHPTTASYRRLPKLERPRRVQERFFAVAARSESGQTNKHKQPNRRISYSSRLAVGAQTVARTRVSSASNVRGASPFVTTAAQPFCSFNRKTVVDPLKATPVTVNAGPAAACDSSSYFSGSEAGGTLRSARGSRFEVVEVLPMNQPLSTDFLCR